EELLSSAVWARWVRVPSMFSRLFRRQLHAAGPPALRARHPSQLHRLVPVLAEARTLRAQGRHGAADLRAGDALRTMIAVAIRGPQLRSTSGCERLHCDQPLASVSRDEHDRIAVIERTCDLLSCVGESAFTKAARSGAGRAAVDHPLD